MRGHTVHRSFRGIGHLPPAFGSTEAAIGRGIKYAIVGLVTWLIAAQFIAGWDLATHGVVDGSRVLIVASYWGLVVAIGSMVARKAGVHLGVKGFWHALAYYVVFLEGAFVFGALLFTFGHAFRVICPNTGMAGRMDASLLPVQFLTRI